MIRYVCRSAKIILLVVFKMVVVAYWIREGEHIIDGKVAGRRFPQQNNIPSSVVRGDARESRWPFEPSEVLLKLFNKLLPVSSRVLLPVKSVLPLLRWVYIHFVYQLSTMILGHAVRSIWSLDMATIFVQTQLLIL